MVADQGIIIGQAVVEVGVKRHHLDQGLGPGEGGKQRGGDQDVVQMAGPAGGMLVHSGRADQAGDETSRSPVIMVTADSTTANEGLFIKLLLLSYYYLTTRLRRLIDVVKGC